MEYDTVLTILVGLLFLAQIAIVFFVGYYVPSYLKKKGENLATKQDIREITDKVESVRSNYAKELELYKREVALMEKRRELSAQVVELINLYKEIPANCADKQKLRTLEQDYYKLIPWIPSDILKVLNSLFNRETPSDQRPDVKDVIIGVRKAILGADCGDFEGRDIVHFLGVWD